MCGCHARQNHFQLQPQLVQQWTSPACRHGKWLEEHWRQSRFLSVDELTLYHPVRFQRDFALYMERCMGGSIGGQAGPHLLRRDILHPERPSSTICERATVVAFWPLGTYFVCALHSRVIPACRRQCVRTATGVQVQICFPLATDRFPQALVMCKTYHYYRPRSKHRLFILVKGLPSTST